MKKINPEILSILSNRFDRQVSESEILAWIYNFDESDWEKAISLLDKVEFFSETRCTRILLEKLAVVRKKHPGSTVTIYPVAGPGKSGNVMAYLFNKMLEKGVLSNMHLVSPNQEWENDNVIVLLDDFVGTGGSVDKFFDEITPGLPAQFTCYCVCVAYMPSGEKRLKEREISILGQEQLRAFLQRGSVFGYPQRMRPVRDFAKKYGEMICPPKPGHKGKYTGPLGYANSQALVCFDHTTPNNSLPILWASAKRSDNGRRWTPLFPRFVSDRIRRNNNFTSHKFYWLSIARKLNDGQINKIFNQFDTESIQLIGVLYAKGHHRSDAYVAALLEIPLWEVNILLERAQALDLIDKDGNLTVFGEYGYKSIRKSLKQQPIIIDELIQKDIIYAPTEFLGHSRFHVNSVKSEEQQMPEIFAAPWL